MWREKGKCTEIHGTQTNSYFFFFVVFLIFQGHQLIANESCREWDEGWGLNRGLSDSR